jgi:hypothetical protein
MATNIVRYFNLQDQIGYGSIPWTPEAISLESWHDASDDTTITIDTGVSQVDDKTGNGHHWTQGVGSNQPSRGTRKINNLDCLDFDGVGTSAGGDRMEISNSFDLMGYDVFIVAHIDNNDTNNKILGGTANNGQYCGIANDQENMRMWRGINFYDADSRGATPTTGTAHLFGFFFRPFKTFMYNGTLTVTGDEPNGNPAIATTVGYGQFTPTYDGLIAECVIALELDDTTRYKMEGYLAHKWGLTGSLPGIHPYKTEAPTI